MGDIILLLVFLAMGIVGLFVMKRLDVFLMKNIHINPEKRDEENIIRIACENPIMISSLLEKAEPMLGEYNKTSFYLYTGHRTDIKKLLENESVDIVLLMEDMHIEHMGNYEKKISSFFPHSLLEPMTGFTIEPLENQQMSMYILWKKKLLQKNSSC